MKRHTLIAIAMAFALPALGACSTTSPYQAATGNTSPGYRDYAIEQNRYRVSYRAPTIEQANDYALRRAAELTLQNNFEWFEVVTRNTDRNASARSGSSVSIGGSTGSGGGVSLGGGIGFGLGSASSGNTLVTMEILMGNGPVPDRPQAYRAAGVVANIAPAY